MKLILVEIKGNDLYVVYDTEKFGVCCCSMYTLKQLVSDFNVEIAGFDLSGSRAVVYECSLDGSRRTKKAPNMCDDLIKRSATTIVRGLEEKHYPRIKQSRRGAGSIVKLSIRSKTNDSIYIVFSDKKIRVSSDWVAYGIQLENGSICLTDNSIFSRKTNASLLASNTIVISTAEVSSDMQDLLIKLGDCRNFRIAKYAEMQKIDSIYNAKIAKLEQEKQKLLKQCESEKAKIEQVRAESLKLSSSLANDFKYRSLTGDEICSYSFYNNSNGVPKDQMLAIIKKTSKPVVYTYGFEYRHPATHRVPIKSKEEALQLASRSMVAITAEGTCIHINEFSGNDMY